MVTRKAPLRPMGGGNGVVDSLVQRVLRELGTDALAQRLARNGGQALPGGMAGPFYRATSATPDALTYTGPDSLFGALGLERSVISTRTQPFGLADRLPVVMSNTLWPQFPYFTDFAGTTGSQPNGVCDDPPTPGPGATCIQTAQFGRVSYQTRVVDITQLHQRIHRGEFTDMSLFNAPLIDGMGGITVPDSARGQFNITNEVEMRMTELGVAFQRWFGRMLYEANPANNTGGGGYREFAGLDILIATGHTDAVTNTACPTLDSLITNFNYGNITLDNGRMTAFIDGLTKIMRYLRTKAAGQNMDPVNWVMVMRPGMFYELTAAWPCNYATYRCAGVSPAAGTGSVSVNVDGMDMAQMRDAMRNGSFLTIDGVNIPVIQDNQIREDSNTNNSSVSNGSFSSDVYILPLTAAGRSMLYWEVFDYSRSVGDVQAVWPGARTFYWTDGGRYIWHLKPPTNWCIQALGLVSPRIILHTPHLAARISNVQYQTALHEPDSLPDDPYFQRGGNTAGYTAPTFNALWGTTS